MEQRAEETFGLDVGLVAVGSPEASGEPMLGDYDRARVAAIAHAAIDKEARSLDAPCGVIPDGADEEAGGRRTGLVVEHFREAHARAVISGDVHVLTSVPARALPTVAVDAMPNALNAPKLLDVEKQRRARLRLLFACRRH